MSNLLPELITEILYRLPVKSLLRFRCVSKPWCSEIDGPGFIKLHLDHSLKANASLTLILADRDNLFSVDFDTLDTVIKRNKPIDGLGITRVLGSCNGLLALFNSHEDLALWNPSTRKYHILPTLPIEIPENLDNSIVYGFETQGNCVVAIVYGFGYDPVSIDYKLVRMVLYYCKDQDSIKSQVKVYSFKSNSWRWARDFPYCHCYCPIENGILANNSLHWMVRKKSELRLENLIVAFDLRVEEFFEVPQPDFMDSNCFTCVQSLGGCLCVVCDYENGGVDIWVMKEYGVKESWIKLFSMARKEDVIGGFEFVTPLAYSKSGDRILLLLEQYDEKFVWYDLRRKRAEEVTIQGVPKLFKVDMCVASLVPLSGGQQAGGN